MTSRLPGHSPSVQNLAEDACNETEAFLAAVGRYTTYTTQLKTESKMIPECPEVDAKGVKNDAPQHVLDTYTLAFEDIFKGQTQLDPLKWNTKLPWGPDLNINDEEQYYVNTLGNPADSDYGWQGANPFSFGPNGLIITAAPIPEADQPTLSPTGKKATYSSGVITTRDSLCYTGGYMEACLKVPCDADGSWLAAWLLNCLYFNNAFDKNQQENGGSGNDKFNPEIDFEWVNGPNSDPECVKNAYHYFTGDRNSAPSYDQWRIDDNDFLQFDPLTGTVRSNFNQYQDCAGNNVNTLPETCIPGYCDDFHTVGIDWKPNDYLHFYIDGQLVNCVNGADNIISDQAMYAIFNFAVGGSFPFGGQPGGTAANKADPNTYPAQMEIEYVRIYTS